MNDKARQLHEVVLELGILVQPVVDLVGGDTPPAIDQYRVACAKVHAGDAPWRQSVRKLTTYGPDVFLNTEFQKTSHVVERFLRQINAKITQAVKSNGLAELQSACAAEVRRMKEDFYECLAEIPVDWKPEIFLANTPFTAYLKLKDAVSSARTRLFYFDRYLQPEFFDLFLRDLPRTIELHLVTTHGNGTYGVEGVRAVSDIARREFSDYRLIEVSPNQLHDRNLVVDEAVFSLGPGVDRAGLALTNFGPSDTSSTAQSEFVRIMQSGVVVHTS